MRPFAKLKPWLLTPLLPALLLTACQTALPPLSPPPVAAPAIPPLPREALLQPKPSICSPSCSAGLTKLRAELAAMQTPSESAMKPLSTPTKP